MKCGLDSILFPLGLAIFGLVLPFRLQAVPSSDEITCERYPDADAVTVNEIEKVRYNADGTYSQTAECWTKILTEKGRRSEGSLTVDYSRRYGEAGIVSVAVMGTNGVERTIDVAATTKEATDNSSMAANIFDPLDRKIVCTIPGLMVGDTLHVKTYRKATKPRCRDQWADLSVMEWSHPILSSTYEVTAPADRPLRKVAIRHPLGNVQTNVTRLADGSIVHTFTVTNSAQVFPEPDMPPLYTQVQNIRVSTAADWAEISRWYWNLCAPHLAKTNSAMAAKARELATIRAIFKFVSQEIRYVGLTMEDTSPGYAPHDVDLTFENRHGVCRDKAGLLVAMLRLAGFKAFPVLIHVGAKLDPDVPQPFFNHAIVAVEETSQHPVGSGVSYTLMDPTNESTKDLFPSYLCDKSYLVARPDGESLRTSPVPSPEANAISAVTSGTLMKEGSVFLESVINFEGINDTVYRQAFVRWQPADRVKFFRRLVKAVSPGAELVRCEIMPKDMRDTEQPIVVKMASRMPEMVLRGETRDELTVPFVSKTLGMVNFLLRGNTSLERRKYPLVLDTTACVRERLTLDLGGALGPVLTLPSEKDDKMAGYGYVRTFGVTNDTLYADRSLTIGAVEFLPAEYEKLRERIKHVEAAERRQTVFGKDPLKEADVNWLLDSTETTVASDRAWTTTNAVIKEILTYEGKKRSAELKFSYNPVVENFQLVSAVVSNRDGRVHYATPKCMSVMDCGWAAAAPRYPAGKTLVVNLPSVEIGSVISYATVREVTNAPAPFYATYCFDSYEPQKHRIVRVNDWRREVRGPLRLVDEPNQPSAAFWRDQVIVSSNRFREVDLKIPALDDSPVPRPASILAIRNWMAKNVKIVGPGLYDIPLDCQLTDPVTVLKERYATRLDYIRTMCALMREASFDADVIFASADADDPAETRRRIMCEKPNVRAFSAPLCRVRVREGGFWGLGGEEKTYFIGTENQYAPLGPTSYEGCDFFDPEAGVFGIVTVPEPDFADRIEERSEYAVRENGMIDLTVENRVYGVGVGSFRKTYSEILPEELSRRYQAILGDVAQAASATSDLETDIEAYPARRKFSCCVPDFAIVQGDTITLQVPPLISSMPALVGTVRLTPFVLNATDDELEEVTIRFPEGYTAVERLPTPFTFANPSNPAEIWMESTVRTEKSVNILTVVLTRRVHKRRYSIFGPSFHELAKEWNRRASSRASRTIVVRKTNLAGR